MKYLTKIINLVNIILMLLLNCSVVSATSQTGSNSLSFSLAVDRDCQQLVQLADCYSLEGGQYSVYNSKNEVVGIFETDSQGIGHVLGSGKDQLDGLPDDTYTIKMTKAVSGFSFDEKVYQLTLCSDKHKVETINVNTVTSLYGKNNNGSYFSNNQYKLWTVDYGTGIFECGIAQADSPCGIKDYGTHSLDVSDAYVLDRNGYTQAGYSNELIYKIMYYGRSGAQQWSHFADYPSPFMSRNGSTQYTGSYSGQTALAAFVTHVALSRCWGKDNGKWSLQSDIAGFWQFWDYVTAASTPKAPEDFIVYVWPHSQVCADEQDMFFGYTLQPTDYDNQHVEATVKAGFDPIRIILTKQSSDSQRIANAQFTMTYYNKDLLDVKDSENYVPVRSWTFQTDENGAFYYLDDWKVSGDELFSYQQENILLPGSYIISETLVPEGYCQAEDFMIKVAPIIGKAVTFYKADGKTVISNKIESGYLLTELQEGYLQVKKSSSCPYFDSSALVNAQYGLFIDPDCKQLAKINNSQQDAVLTINNSGFSDTIPIAVGSYYLKEISAPSGFYLDEQIYPVEISESQTVTIESVDEPVFDPVEVLLRKVDEKTDLAVSDCVFTVKFYRDRQYSEISQLDDSYDRCWLFKTNQAGLIDLSDPDCLIGGDQLYYYEGRPVLLNGTYLFSETSTPSGYQPVEDFFIYHHNQSNDEKTVEFTPILVKEKWKILAQIAKLDEKGQYLASAKLQLLDADYQLTASFISSEGPIDISEYVKENQSYILREVQSPSGYQLSEDVSFKVEALFNQYNIVTMIDYPICTIETRAESSLGNQFVSEGEQICHDIVTLDKLRSNYQYYLVSKLFNLNDLTEPLATVITEVVSDTEKTEVQVDFNATFVCGNEYIIFQYLYDENNHLIVSHQSVDDAKQKLYCPSIDTYCYDKTDQDKFITVAEKVQLIDEVRLTKLIEAEAYQLYGEVFDLKNQMVVADGSQTFVYDGQPVMVDLEFTIADQDSDQYVISETLLYQGKVIARHNDLTDLDQTVYAASISSYCYDGSDQDKYLSQTAKNLIDQISYQGVIANKSYQLVSELVDYNSQQVVKRLVNDFKLETADGNLTINMACDNLAEGKYVMFQYLYCEGNLIASDADIANEKQTVYLPAVKTNASITQLQKDQITIKDQMFVANLIEEESYNIITTLYSHKQQTVLQESYKNDFIFHENDQVIEIDIELDAALLKDDSLTVLQQIYDCQNNLVIAHQNIMDDNQTVRLNDLEVKITKVDGTDRKALADCLVAVYLNDNTLAKDVNGEVCLKTTDKDGKAVFSLPYNSLGYYVKEIRAPEGYQKTEQTYPVLIEMEQSQIKQVAIEIKNNKVADTNDIEISVVVTVMITTLFLLIGCLYGKKTMVGTE